MSESRTKLTRQQAPRNRTVLTHRYAVGAAVLYGIGGKTEKSRFKITRQMPDGGDGFQYRIKADHDGQERIVTEANLERI
ncbi:MAG: hypothetical protein WAK03_12760 [Methylocystis sp.]|jgi:hypothetical protein